MKYKKLLEIIEERSKLYETKNKYYASKEYMAIFPFLKATWDNEYKAKRSTYLKAKRKFRKEIEQLTLETGFPIGLFI